MTERSWREREGGSGPRTTAVACALVLSGVGSASAQWDLATDVAVRETWAENTTFTSNPGNGDAVSTVRLGERLLRTGDRFHLNAQYSPAGLFYRDTAEFNRLEQTGRLNASYDLTQRDAITFAGTYFYTTSQGVAAETVSSPLVLTQFSDRRQQFASLGYRRTLTERLSYGVDVRNNFQTFSDFHFVDYAAYGVSAHVNRKMGPAWSLDGGAGETRNRFTTPADPNNALSRTTYGDASVASLFSGVNRRIGDRMTVTGRLGYNLVTPGDGTQPNRRALFAQGTLTWSGPRLNSSAGFTRDINTGTGVIDLSETETLYGSGTFSFTPDFSATVLVNRSYSRRVGDGSSEATRAFNGTASLRRRLTRKLEASAGFSRYIQNSQNLALPDLAHNAYFVGLSASFD